jgi:hypothetical protein
MEAGEFNWRILRTLSNCAFVVMAVILALGWYNDNQFESVMNDPTAKAYWVQTRHLYDRVGLVSMGLLIGLRICYWTIEYIHDRRMIAATKGDG